MSFTAYQINLSQMSGNVIYVYLFSVHIMSFLFLKVILWTTVDVCIYYTVDDYLLRKASLVPTGTVNNKGPVNGASVHITSDLIYKNCTSIATA